MSSQRSAGTMEAVEHPEHARASDPGSTRVTAARRHSLLATAAISAVVLIDFAHPQAPLILQSAGLGIAALPMAGFAAPVIPPHLSPPSPSDRAEFVASTPGPPPQEPLAAVAGPAPPENQAPKGIGETTNPTPRPMADLQDEAPLVGPPAKLAGFVVPRDFDHALQLYDRGDIKALPALEAYIESSTGAGDVARTHYLIGRLMLGEGRGRAARSAFSKAAPGLKAIEDKILYDLADSAFVAGDLLTARKEFGKFVARHGASPWAPRARFRLADIGLALGDWAWAQALYEELLGRYPEYPGAAQVRFNIAHCLEELGKTRTAAGRYRDLRIALRDPDVGKRAGEALERLAKQGVTPRPLKDSERLKWAKSLSYWKRWGDAEELFGPLIDDLRTRRRPDEHLAEAHYWRGRNFYAFERFEDALLELRAAKDRGVGGKVRHWLAKTYERLGRPDDAAAVYAQYKHGPNLHEKLQDMYFDEAKYEMSRLHLELLFEGRPWLRRKSHYRWRMAWLDYRQGKLEEAEKAFDSMTNIGKRLKWKARYWHARTLERLGRPDEARDRYKSITSRITTSYYALQAENRLRDLDTPPEQRRQPRPVAGYMSGLPLAPAPSEPAPWARRPATRQPFGHRNRMLVDSLADRPIVPPPPSLPVGRSSRGARVEWDTAEDPAAGGDGAGVSERQASQEPLVEESELVISPYGPDDSAAVTFAKLVKRYGPLFPRLARAEEFARLGRWWQVRRDLEAVLNEVREVKRNGTGRNARVLSALGGSFIDHREHKKGVWGSALDPATVPASVLRIDGRRRRELARLTGRFYRDLGAGFAHAGAAHYAKKYLLLSGEHLKVKPDGDEKDRALWARAYPRAYEELVLRYSIENGVPPYLMWAVMTVESSHYPAAVSRANARGLMQVIPKTGYLTGRQMGLRGWSAAKLSEPEVAIRLGCWYMAQLLKKFRGQEPLAIAGYNGGPHNVAYWLKRKGSLPLDEFIEEMRFTQARGYTKKVLKFARLYRRIYTDSRELYVSNDLNPAYRDNINF